MALRLGACAAAGEVAQAPREGKGGPQEAGETSCKISGVRERGAISRAKPRARDRHAQP